MLSYHEKKIKTAIDLLKIIALLAAAIVIAFILITLFDYWESTLFFGE
jgi:hypothetical protein